MTKTEMLALPRCYADALGERECALYIDGQYVTRGPVSQGLGPATHGWFGQESAPPERITFELDAPTFPGGRDVRNLCWQSGVRLTAAEFVVWLRRA